MSSKRKISESDPREAIHPSRQAQVPGSNPKPPKKPRRTEPAVYKKQAHASSVNAIKKRIRDVSRRLERAEDLPATVRMEDERALAAYQQELVAADAEKTRQKMIKKYHMVRFFERQKATRQLKKLRKRLLETESTDEVEALKKEMYMVEVDLNYAQFYPLSEPYISLYPQKNATEEGESKAEKKPKPPMWVEVEKCMEEGTLDKLRNRRPAGQAVVVSKPLERRPAKPKPESTPVDTTGMNRRQRRSQRGVTVTDSRVAKGKSMGFARNQAFGAEFGAKADDGPGDESDGGFFEE